MTKDIENLLSGFDESQLEGLHCILLKLAKVKHERFTGVATLEMHVSQGKVGDIYSSDKEKIRSSRKRRVRSSGIK